MREEQFGTRELGYRAALTGVALYALGDASSIAQFQRAIQLDVPPGPAMFFIGAARALEGREADAISAWQSVLDGGMPRSMVVPLLVNAHLRRGDAAQAASLLKDGTVTGWGREQAALHIAAGQARDAIPLVEQRLAAEPGDADAQWLMLHALFASVVHQPDASLSEKFVTLARPYVASQRAYAALVGEWLKIVEQ
jgi:hypothetical protein